MYNIKNALWGAIICVYNMRKIISYIVIIHYRTLVKIIKPHPKYGAVVAF